MTPAPWLDRAERSLSSARLLLASDPDAACSRAYYAMFYAGRAALLRAGYAEAALGKSHSGLISAFGEKLAKTGQVSTEHSSAFSTVHQIRLVADYSGGGVTRQTAEGALAKASAFVAAMSDFVKA